MGKETKEPAISLLRNSSKRIGRLCPVLLDKEGNVIDGQHRLAADADWPKIRLDHIRSEKERLLARLISNVCRRMVSTSEKRETLERLGRIYIEEGERPGKLAYRIAEETGMSYRWVMKYLPERLKERPGLGGPSLRLVEIYKCKEKNHISKVGCCATVDLARLLSKPEKRCVVVKNYTNATFVNLTIEKQLYENFERIADHLGVTAETIISNTLILTLKEIEKMTLSANPIIAEKSTA
jgi:hypothetical protein